MKILFNNQTLELKSPISVNLLLEQLDYHQLGSALSINQIIIPHIDWPNHFLQDGDNVLLFQAIAGG